jgi:hypothetical protein
MVNRASIGGTPAVEVPPGAARPHLLPGARRNAHDHRGRRAEGARPQPAPRHRRRGPRDDGERPRAVRHAADRAGRPGGPARHRHHDRRAAPSGPMYELYKYGKESSRPARAQRPALRVHLVRGAPGARGRRPSKRGARPTRRWAVPAARSSSARPPPTLCSGRMPEFMFRRLHLNQWTSGARALAAVPEGRWRDGDPGVPRGRSVVWRSTPPSPATRSASRWSGTSVEDSAGEMRGPTSRMRQAVRARARRRLHRPRAIVTYVLGLAEQYQITKRIVYDPAYMQSGRRPAVRAGLPCEPFPQSAQRMERATEDVPAAVHRRARPPRRRRAPAGAHL